MSGFIMRFTKIICPNLGYNTQDLHDNGSHKRLFYAYKEYQTHHKDQ